MANRAQDMATIDTALLDLQKPRQEMPEPEPKQSLIPFPPQEKDAQGKVKLSPEEKQRIQAEKDIEKAQEKLLGKEEADRLKAEKEAEERQAAIVQAAKGAYESSKQVVKSADVSLGKLPTPGQVVFPLIILLVLFLIIVQVAGHSRLEWLWMVITGQAFVSGDPSQFQGGTQTNTSLATPQVQPTQEDYPPMVLRPLASPNGVYGSPF